MKMYGSQLIRKSERLWDRSVRKRAILNPLNIWLIYRIFMEANTLLKSILIMRKNKVKLIVTSLLFALITGNAFCQSADEEAIKETALNYIEGWYSADTARMAKALSPDLAKRGFVLNPRTKKLVIAPATYEQMLQWVGQKPNELESDPEKPLEVVIIEVGEYIAMVKTITPDFIDYLHMGKMDGVWKIYNAIWERPPQK